MAYFAHQVTVQPLIPASLVKQRELEILKLFFDYETSPGIDGKEKLYFFSKEYPHATEDKYGNEVTEIKIIDIFQNIIRRSNGCLDYVYLHGASQCSNVCADAFGGWVLFIWVDSAERFSTWDKIAELKK